MGGKADRYRVGWVSSDPALLRKAKTVRRTVFMRERLSTLAIAGVGGLVDALRLLHSTPTELHQFAGR